jgi:hypothetical protein
LARALLLPPLLLLLLVDALLLLALLPEKIGRLAGNRLRGSATGEGELAAKASAINSCWERGLGTTTLFRMDLIFSMG